MSDKTAICGLGMIGGFGVGNAAALQSLSQPRGPNGRVPAQYGVDVPTLPAYVADVGSLERFLNKRLLRRVNRYSKMALLGACLALEDAQYDIPVGSDRMGVIVASGYGALSTTFAFLDSMIDDGDALASPLLFSNSVHSSAASHITICLNIRGPSLTVSQFEMSGVAALMTAQQWLARGVVDAVLVGAVEELNTVTGYCYAQFYSPDTVSSTESKAIMGEGACFFLLRRASDAAARYGLLERANWLHVNNVAVLPEAMLVCGDDGHPCCAAHYARFPHAVSFAQCYGSLPSGQLFDAAFALLAAQQKRQPTKIQVIKMDKDGNAGEVMLSMS